MDLRGPTSKEKGRKKRRKKRKGEEEKEEGKGKERSNPFPRTKILATALLHRRNILLHKIT